MSVDDRLDRLERRLAALEMIVRGRSAAREAGQAQPTPLRETAPREPPGAAASPAPPHPTPTHRARPAPSRRSLPTEEWIGQRGLLAVGVVLLVLAAAYLLKLAFDRGWISPALRCAGGAVAGIAVGSIGGHLYRRGLRTYGASLMGAGAAIVYLALWAAARLYGLVPPGAGIAGLAVVSLILAALAYRLDIEALGAAAAIGALFAPIVIGSDRATADALLIYLACVGLALGAVGALRRWRLTTALVALTYFGLGAGAAEHAAPGGVVAYALAGATGGLTFALRAGWPETRLLAFAGGWSLLAIASGRMSPHWPVSLGAVVLAIPIWSRALRSPTVWPDPSIARAARAWSLGETTYFYLTPLFVGLLVRPLAPAWFAAHAGAVPLIVALPYLLAGFTSPRIPFALAGTTALALAAEAEWSGLGAVWALLACSAAWAGIDHALRRTDGRWYALLALALAAAHLLFRDLGERGSGPGFLDPWALSLWTCVVTIVALAMGLWRPVVGAPATSPEGGTRRVPPGRRPWHAEFLDLGRTLPPIIPAILWAAAGLLVFGGVTGELRRSLGQMGLSPATAQLAGGLAVSAWWAVCAGGLVLLGFHRGLQPVRVAGLLVAALAVAKVVLVDLSRLDALYRVASVLTLGLVSLLVAYLYHRQARAAPAARADAGPTP